VRAGLAAAMGLLFLTGGAFAAAPVNLPVYIEDSHAGTFYWIIQNLPLDHDYQLVLIDAHSDASEILHSDTIRADVLRAASDNQLDQLFHRWRSTGTIQCFNWIEPLIPQPISKVWWVPAKSMSSEQIAQKRGETVLQINAHEEAVKRSEGRFNDRFDVVALDRFLTQRIDSPVIVSVDLDYFASDYEFANAGTTLAKILDHVLEFPNLDGITFSISTPYLASENQAHLLLYEALRYVTSIVNTEIYFEPFARTGIDHSEKAKEFYRKRASVPTYNIEDAPPILRSFLLQNAARIQVHEESQGWNKLLEKWRHDERLPHVTLWMADESQKEQADYEIPAEERYGLKIDNLRKSAAFQIHWKILVASREKYNLANENQGFADDSPKYLTYRVDPVPAADGLEQLPGALLLPFLDKKTGWGTLRVFCEVTSTAGTYLSNVIQFSRYEGSGYIGRLTEIFNLPYIYGSGLLQVSGKNSADAKYGADCSNFIIYGRRRQGFRIPYLNPRELLPYLKPIDEFQGLHDGIAYGTDGPIRVTPELIRTGLLLHFGKHVAAVYSDDSHRGVLNERTLVVHQLETYPEITTFGAMAEKYKTIRIMTFK
jgi:hypothetical protein